MKCIDHEDAVNIPIEDLDKECTAIVGEFEEVFLGNLIVFCYVSVPDRAVEIVERTTGWGKIASNTFQVDGFESEVIKILEKIDVKDLIIQPCSDLLKTLIS